MNNLNAVQLCPVCKAVCDENAAECKVCGFADQDKIHRNWLLLEDGNDWTANVVLPYARRWFTSQLSESRKKETALSEQLCREQSQLKQAQNQTTQVERELTQSKTRGKNLLKQCEQLQMQLKEVQNQLEQVNVQRKPDFLRQLEPVKAQPEAVQNVYENTKSKNVALDLGNVKAGDIIPFGQYNWRVLEVNADSVLVITEDIVEKKEYHNEKVAITWAKCSLHKYLNSKFYNTFANDEKKLILTANVKNSDNYRFGRSEGSNTKDKIFLLSIDEAERLFKSDNDRAAKYRGGAWWWWLRSPGNYRDHAADVRTGGYLSMYGLYVYNVEGGVRPALLLNRKSIISKS